MTELQKPDQAKKTDQNFPTPENSKETLSVPIQGERLYDVEKRADETTWLVGPGVEFQLSRWYGDDEDKSLITDMPDEPEIFDILDAAYQAGASSKDQVVEAAGVYVAGKFGEYEHARAIMDQLAAMGFEIGHDWTRTPEFGDDGHPLPQANSNHGADLDESVQAAHAQDDLDGVSRSGFLLLLSHADIYGALIEFGVALAEGKQIIVVAPKRHSIFFTLPNVTVVDSDEAAIEHLATALNPDSETEQK